jgi:hypothetical protein
VFPLPVELLSMLNKLTVGSKPISEPPATQDV